MLSRNMLVTLSGRVIWNWYMCSEQVFHLKLFRIFKEIGIIPMRMTSPRFQCSKVNYYLITIVFYFSSSTNRRHQKERRTKIHLQLLEHAKYAVLNRAERVRVSMTIFDIEAFLRTDRHTFFYLVMKVFGYLQWKSFWEYACAGARAK